jgi:hypothetical protein
MRVVSVTRPEMRPGGAGALRSVDETSIAHATVKTIAIRQDGVSVWVRAPAQGCT